jgi:pimeloyl-ACP methyl ester carboxylesterase
MKNKCSCRNKKLPRRKNMNHSTFTAIESNKPILSRACRWLKRIGVTLLAVVVLGLLIGFIYQTVATRLDDNRFPAPGQLVDMGGYRLHINYQGPVGKGPTVVIDAGMGEGTLSWLLVTPELVSDIRVCTFDRAGMGWSEPGSRSPSVADRNEELHQLLQRAGIQPPYVMVGHSLGGAYAFAYMHRYPDETAGLVLVDSGNKNGTGVFDQWVAGQPLADSERQAYQNTVAQFQQMMALVPLFQIPDYIKAGLAPFGSMRLYFSFNSASDKYPPSLQSHIGETLKALHSRNSFYGAYVRENESQTQIFKDAYATMTGCGNKPIVVLSASQSVSPLAPDSPSAKSLSPDMLTYFNLISSWQSNEHVKLAACSTQGQRRIVDSSHYMTFDQPSAVASAIRQVVQSAMK